MCFILAGNLNVFKLISFNPDSPPTRINCRLGHRSIECRQETGCVGQCGTVKCSTRTHWTCLMQVCINLHKCSAFAKLLFDVSVQFMDFLAIVPVFDRRFSWLFTFWTKTKTLTEQKHTHLWSTNIFPIFHFRQKFPKLQKSVFSFVLLSQFHLNSTNQKMS